MNEMMHKAVFPTIAALEDTKGQEPSEKTQLGTFRDHKYCKWTLQRKVQKEEWSQFRIIKCVEGKKQTLKDTPFFLLYLNRVKILPQGGNSSFPQDLTAIPGNQQQPNRQWG